ncbi:chemotaxis protein [Shewanella sp. D64]|uniref:chemotaxis protein n=1 Tax=unclassified Shewanella TaxID=196818 RepID=UPI0022BA451C|nr:MULTISPECIES: chemotaxis protein [unclassified Shewanella]MEC4725283.1 chemotaxis protein [Shewanella sp. D64]MEC4735871.1 chemotaxis protein [Shewanella sp. E94]WBJ93160.1 chemotaxis protein [Shewanella sp. MTB7]
MQIPPSYSSGQAGLQSAQSGLTQATVDVASPTPAPSQSSQSAESGEARPIENVDKTEALISAVEAQNQGEASAEVLETSSETVGTIINIEV